MGFSRGQSRFSGTGWAEEIREWSLIVRGGGGKPQSDVSLHRAPQVTSRWGPAFPENPWRWLWGHSCFPCPDAASPAVVLLVLPPCCPAWLQPTHPKLCSPDSSRCFLGFGSGCAHNIFSPVPAAFCARVPRGGGCGGGRVEGFSGREEEEVAEGSPEVSSCFWEHP